MGFLLCRSLRQQRQQMFSQTFLNSPHRAHPRSLPREDIKTILKKCMCRSHTPKPDKASSLLCALPRHQVSQFCPGDLHTGALVREEAGCGGARRGAALGGTSLALQRTGTSNQTPTSWKSGAFPHSPRQKDTQYSRVRRIRPSNEGGSKARQRDPTLLIEEDVVWFYVSGKRSKVTVRRNLSQIKDATQQQKNPWNWKGP